MWIDVLLIATTLFGLAVFLIPTFASRLHLYLTPAVSWPFGVMVPFCIQTLLCRHVRALIVQLLPVLLFGTLFLIGTFWSAWNHGWNAVLGFLLSLFVAVPLAGCLLAWCVALNTTHTELLAAFPRLGKVFLGLAVLLFLRPKAFVIVSALLGLFWVVF